MFLINHAGFHHFLDLTWKKIERRLSECNRSTKLQMSREEQEVNTRNKEIQIHLFFFPPDPLRPVQPRDVTSCQVTRSTCAGAERRRRLPTNYEIKELQTSCRKRFLSKYVMAFHLFFFLICFFFSKVIDQSELCHTEN